MLRRRSRGNNPRFNDCQTEDLLFITRSAGIISTAGCKVLVRIFFLSRGKTIKDLGGKKFHAAGARKLYFVAEISLGHPQNP